MTTHPETIYKAYLEVTSADGKPVKLNEDRLLAEYEPECHTRDLVDAFRILAFMYSLEHPSDRVHVRIYEYVDGRKVGEVALDSAVDCGYMK